MRATDSQKTVPMTIARGGVSAIMCCKCQILLNNVKLLLNEELANFKELKESMSKLACKIIDT